MCGSDNTIKVISPQGDERSVFPNGTIQLVSGAGHDTVVDYPNGRKEIFKPDGSKVRVYPDGSTKVVPPATALKPADPMAVSHVRPPPLQTPAPAPAVATSASTPAALGMACEHVHRVGWGGLDVSVRFVDEA